jgi:hypothetical protein
MCASWKSRAGVASLAVTLLVAGGCVGGGSAAAKPTVLVIRHTTAAWIPRRHGWREGPRHTDVYYLSCPAAGGFPKPVAALCDQLVSQRGRYFGRVRAELTPSMPITDDVTVSGIVSGSKVRVSYNAGAKPQFPLWMRLLAVLRRG